MNERKHFEAWATVAAFAVIPDGDGYTNTVTHRAWEAWQAAKSDQAEELVNCKANFEFECTGVDHLLKVLGQERTEGGTFNYRKACAAVKELQARIVVLEDALTTLHRVAKESWLRAYADTPIKLGELKLPNGEKFEPQENSHDVLVWRRGGSADISRLIRAHDGTTIWYFFNDEVTHWQPLPAPPKESK